MVFLIWSVPWVMLLFAVILVFSWSDGRKDKTQIAALLAERRDESICDFARSFDTKAVDTWIIRATYEALQPYVELAGESVPIRADDRLNEDLKIDGDDLDLDVVEVIAQRTGRSFSGYRQNPYCGKVHTVRDLVMFFNVQPKVGEA